MNYQRTACVNIHQEETLHLSKHPEFTQATEELTRFVKEWGSDYRPTINGELSPLTISQGVLFNEKGGIIDDMVTDMIIYHIEQRLKDPKNTIYRMLREKKWVDLEKMQETIDLAMSQFFQGYRIRALDM